MPFDAGPRPPHDDPEPTRPRDTWTWRDRLFDWFGRLTFFVAFATLYSGWIWSLFGPLVR